MQGNRLRRTMLFPRLRSEKVAPAGQLESRDIFDKCLNCLKCSKLPKINVFCLFKMIVFQSSCPPLED